MSTFEDIYLLFDGFKEFFKWFTSHIERNDKSEKATVTIRYLPFTYDLIDKDLDYDELYYENIINNFKKFMKVYALSLFKKDEQIFTVEILQFKEIWRDNVILYQTDTFMKNDQNICHSSTTYHNINMQNIQ